MARRITESRFVVLPRVEVGPCGVQKPKTKNQIQIIIVKTKILGAYGHTSVRVYHIMGDEMYDSCASNTRISLILVSSGSALSEDFCCIT